MVSLVYLPRTLFALGCPSAADGSAAKRAWSLRIALWMRLVFTRTPPTLLSPARRCSRCRLLLLLAGAWKSARGSCVHTRLWLLVIP